MLSQWQSNWYSRNMHKSWFAAIVVFIVGSASAQTPAQIYDYMIENRVGFNLAVWEQGFTIDAAERAFGINSGSDSIQGRN